MFGYASKSRNPHRDVSRQEGNHKWPSFVANIRKDFLYTFEPAFGRAVKQRTIDVKDTILSIRYRRTSVWRPKDDVAA